MPLHYMSATRRDGRPEHRALCDQLLHTAASHALDLMNRMAEDRMWVMAEYVTRKKATIKACHFGRVYGRPYFAGGHR